MVLLVQTTVGQVLVFTWPAVGTVGPDLLAIVVLFIALEARGPVDVMLAAWVLGAAVDLTTGGGAGVIARAGPMAVAYVVAAWVICQVREAFFRERPITRAVLGALFCAVAHGLWVTLQSLLAMRWSDTGAMFVQVACLTAYTAVLTPLGHWGLGKCRRLILSAPAGRSRHGRR